ncbi:hypothetical protein ACP8S1_25930, partial [Klebsiella pneumoniae]
LNRLIRCVCGKKIGPDPRNFNQRVSLGRNDLLIRTFPSIMVKLPSNNSESCIFYTATGIPKEEGLYLAELFSKGLYIQRNIEESLTMELREIEDLLLGICLLWHESFVGKISLSKFVNILQQNEINDISERTLKARKDKAKYWLMQWPSQLPLIS